MKRKMLLLVEDNLVLRGALKEILSMEGFSVFAASNGLEALSIMEVVLPDLIISDISMPQMNGEEFFKAVRNRSEWIAIPFIFLTAHGDEEAILTGRSLGAEDYLVKPINQDELMATVNARLKRAQELQIVQLQEAYESSLMMLTNAIESRDRYTRGHVERVRDYSLMIGEELGWEKTQLQDLRFGAILHDIGKIYVGESILRKEIPLNSQDWEIIQNHPLVGVDMLKGIPYLAPAIPVVRSHHERWDGSGYPDGLKGEEIPLLARVVAVADVFDAITSDRVYQKARSLKVAYQEILDQSGLLFDTAIVEAFKTLWKKGEIQKIVEMLETIPKEGKDIP
ncbi:MAG: response regulator [Chloroflexota bacterium]|nr:response regulator [Chloroflexota bacterium]